MLNTRVKRELIILGKTIIISGLLACGLTLGQVQAGDKFKLPALADLISDTLFIDVQHDTSIDPALSGIQVVDSRELAETIIGIRQTKVLRYIPVDQYLALDQPLAKIFQSQFLRDSLEVAGTLHLSNLILWTDNSAVQQKGLCLSAYTTFHDTSDLPVSDWIWELRVKREKKEVDSLYLGRVIQEFAREQSQALATSEFNPDFYPYLFRRQLMTWSEFILFKDGYAVNVHFTLNFPADQQSNWKRGSPGLFYRRTSVHESIAIGGMDQQWFTRLSPDWITQFSGTYRFGFNNFERGKFTHVNYQNLLYINVSGQASLEYRPVYNRGLYGGLGLYAGYNLLPDIVPQTELGLFVRIGMMLP